MGQGREGNCFQAFPLVNLHQFVGPAVVSLFVVVDDHSVGPVPFIKELDHGGKITLVRREAGFDPLAVFFGHCS